MASNIATYRSEPTGDTDLRDRFLGFGKRLDGRSEASTGSLFEQLLNMTGNLSTFETELRRATGPPPRESTESLAETRREDLNDRRRTIDRSDRSERSQRSREQESESSRASRPEGSQDNEQPDEARRKRLDGSEWIIVEAVDQQSLPSGSTEESLSDGVAPVVNDVGGRLAVGEEESSTEFPGAQLAQRLAQKRGKQPVDDRTLTAPEPARTDETALDVTEPELATDTLKAQEEPVEPHHRAKQSVNQIEGDARSPEVPRVVAETDEPVAQAVVAEELSKAAAEQAGARQSVRPATAGTEQSADAAVRMGATNPDADEQVAAESQRADEDGDLKWYQRDSSLETKPSQAVAASFGEFTEASSNKLDAAAGEPSRPLTDSFSDTSRTQPKDAAERLGVARVSQSASNASQSEAINVSEIATKSKGSTSSRASDGVSSPNSTLNHSAGDSLSMASSASSGADRSARNGSPVPSSQAFANTGDAPGISQQVQVRLIQRVARSFSRLGPSGGNIELRLHPPELGSLAVQVRMEGRNMTAKLTTESTAAREVILENLPVLRGRLAEQGFDISQFQVDVAENGSDATFGQNGGEEAANQFSERQPHRRNWSDSSKHQPNSETDQTIHEVKTDGGLVGIPSESLDVHA